MRANPSSSRTLSDRRARVSPCTLGPVVRLPNPGRRLVQEREIRVLVAQGAELTRQAHGAAQVFALYRDAAIEDSSIKWCLRTMIQAGAATYAVEDGLRVRHPAPLDARLLGVVLGRKVQLAKVVEEAIDDLFEMRSRNGKRLPRPVILHPSALPAKLMQERVVATVWREGHAHQQLALDGSVHRRDHRRSFWPVAADNPRSPPGCGGCRLASPAIHAARHP